MLPIITLKPKEQRRLKSGHLWIFRDEMQPLSESLVSGSIVHVHTASGHDLGIGFYHAESQIAIRLLRYHGTTIDESFFLDRCTTALALRKRLFPQEHSYRLVFGESDFLPGLIIDRYHDGTYDYFAIQCLSVAMDERLPMIVSALRTLLPNTAGINAKTTSWHRQKQIYPRE